MTKQRLVKFKKSLEAKQAELAQAFYRREHIAIESSPDAFEHLQLKADRDLALRHLHEDSERLRRVRAALRRLEDGTFGRCINCGEEIRLARLVAVPWTPYCRGCQESAEQGGGTLGETGAPALAASR